MLESRRSAGVAATQPGRVYTRPVAHAINVQTASMLIPFPLFGRRQCSPAPVAISRNTGRSRPPCIMHQRHEDRLLGRTEHCGLRNRPGLWNYDHDSFNEKLRIFDMQRVRRMHPRREWICKDRSRVFQKRQCFASVSDFDNIILLLYNLQEYKARIDYVFTNTYKINWERRDILVEIVRTNVGIKVRERRREHETR